MYSIFLFMTIMNWLKSTKVNSYFALFQSGVIHFWYLKVEKEGDHKILSDFADGYGWFLGKRGFFNPGSIYHNLQLYNGDTGGVIAFHEGRLG